MIERRKAPNYRDDPSFIPLTQAQIDAGIDKETMDRLRAALDVDSILPDFRKLVQQALAKQSDPESDEAA